MWSVGRGRCVDVGMWGVVGVGYVDVEHMWGREGMWGWQCGMWGEGWGV